MTSLGRYAAQLHEITDKFLATPDSRRNSFGYATTVKEIAKLMEREAKLAETQQVAD